MISHALPLAETAATPGASTPLVLGKLSCTHDALIQVGVIAGVGFVLSLLLKRLCISLGARMNLANPLTGTAFRAGARFTHLLIFALTLRGVIATDGLSFGSWQTPVENGAGIFLIAAFTIGLLHLVAVPVTWFRIFADKTESKLDDMLVPVVDTSLRVLVIAGGIIQAIHHLSGNTPAQIVAALGVGGLALGLAAQDTIKNFFGSIMLIVDKPFSLGDLVDTGAHLGTVEALGLRSTRLRTPEGHLVSIPNGILANQPIRNIGARPHIRQLFTLGLVYSTPPDKLEEAVAIVRATLENHEGLDPSLPPRVHLNNLSAYAAEIQVLYWYHPADWWKFNAFHQSLLLDLLRKFSAVGISMAFPTQTLEIKTVTPPPASR